MWSYFHLPHCEEKQFCSLIGNYILAVFKQPESYQCLKSALVDIISDIEQLREVTDNGVKFQITYLVGGRLEVSSHCYRNDSGQVPTCLSGASAERMNVGIFTEGGH